MKNSNDSTCPICQARIPEDAPDGLCPKCALESAAKTANHTARGALSAPPSIDEISPHFPELEIAEIIGAGGMGAVYKARQPQLDRFVALKILSHDLASDPAFVERFNREARVLARLNHPNIVGVHDFGTAGPYCYLTMELVDGVNLRQAMQAGSFTPSETLATVQHLCSALKFAHEEGILHRDIKPENILIDTKGRVKIADFGIAKLVGDGQQGDFTLTMRGSVLGSPHYMAPEQIETPDDVDQRVDIYSLGVVLYEMLTGELPIGRFALPSEKAEMDARIDEIVLRTLAKERKARYQTADEVSTSMNEVTKHPASPRSASAPSQAETGIARFSTLSAILTTISLPLGIISVLLALNSPSWMLLNPLILAGTALPGFILGIMALYNIRSSGGTKGGLGRTLFSLSAWPILLLSVITVFSFPAGGMSWKSDLLIPLAALVALITGILLVWNLRRWALGAIPKSGSRFRPGLGLRLLMIALFAVVGPILISQMSIGFTSPAGSLSKRLNPNSWGIKETVYYNEDDIDWRLGVPELALNLKVLSSIRAEFFLVIKNEQGEPVKYSRIGVWEGQTGPQSRISFIVKIGTLGSSAGDTDSEGGFAGHLNLTGESGKITGITDIGKWRLEAFEDISDLYGGPSSYSYGQFINGTSSIRLGERRVVIDEGSELTEVLELEVRSSPIR